MKPVLRSLSVITTYDRDLDFINMCIRGLHAVLNGSDAVSSMSGCSPNDSETAHFTEKDGSSREIDLCLSSIVVLGIDKKGKDVYRIGNVTVTVDRS